MDNNIAHLLRIASEINTPFSTHVPIPVSIAQLSSTLCCTPRNVKFILRKLEDKGLIQWQAGRGRGHTSEMTFLCRLDEVMEEYLEELIRKGRIRQAIELIGLPEVNGTLKERLLTLLNKQMGYQSEEESNSGLDILRITRSRHVEKLDPAFVYRAFEAYLLGQICSTLVTYDSVSDIFQPGLAHMWESNEDHTSYMFYLRKGVRFHHGRVLTSRDVLYTWERLVELNSPALWHFRGIQDIELLGDHRVRFNLSSPNRFFLHALSSVYMSILPLNTDFVHEPIGSGPYKLLNSNEDVLVLAAFDDYYNIRPLLDRVEIWYLPNPGSATRSTTRQYQLPEAESTSSSSKEYISNSMDYQALGCRYILVNFCKEGLHQNAVFRQVMSILYDPVALIRELGGNRITPADSFLPWISQRKVWIGQPLEEACQLLQTSGYGGEEITLAYTLKKDELAEAQWLQQRAESIGLHLRLMPYKDYDMAEVKQLADFLFAEEVLEDDWQWGMINYFVNKANHLHILLQDHQREQLEQKLETFAELSHEGRSHLLEETEAILRDNCWILYGCHMNIRAQLDQNLFGLHTGPFGFLDISRLWIKSAYPDLESE